MIRVFLGLRNDDNLAENQRVSQFNNESQSFYSAQNAALEKKLMHDAAYGESQLIMCNILDLEVHCNY